MAARKLRHDFLVETAARCKSDAIAFGHHADDQVEPFWLRLLRGDSGIGLAGMRWKRPAKEGSAIEVIRPMLDVSRDEIEAFARAENIPFREDSSNSQLAYQRNRLRHEVLPALEKFQSELRSISLRTAELLGAEKEFVSEIAAEWLREQKSSFHDLDPALQREIVRLQLLTLAVRPSPELIERLRLSTKLVSGKPAWPFGGLNRESSKPSRANLPISRSAHTRSNSAPKVPCSSIPLKYPGSAFGNAEPPRREPNISMPPKLERGSFCAIGKPEIECIRLE